MKIPYKKQRSTSALISGILWGIYGAYGVYQGINSTVDYVAPILSICYFIFFLFDKETLYFTLENGNIKTRKFLGKRISLSEIEYIDENEDQFILKSKNLDLQIDKQVIPFETLDRFKATLKKFNLDWD